MNFSLYRNTLESRNLPKVNYRSVQLRNNGAARNHVDKIEANRAFNVYILI